ncbi:T9SS type A sorting domain-containing protein [Flavobacterium ardleyense]|uniref:T9SS type A sorting domain-containing protein n=1 Tax=Flavobacterium ardleyense TaxID=2038737 RepID=A0ABW5ZAG5_9FLAO
MTKNYLLSFLFLFSSFFTFAQREFLDGILVLNEGGRSTVSFISETSTVTNNLYGLSNDDGQMGNIGQSLTMHDDIAIIAINGFDKVVIANNKTFVNIATISSGVVNPRYTAVYNNKAYVTCWGSGVNATDDYLAVIDLTTNTLEAPIPMPEGVEKIKEINGKLYIAHQGGYNTGNIVTVYDISAGTTTTISVNDVPTEMIKAGNFLYVLSAGLQPWQTGGPTAASLAKIDLSTDTVLSTVNFDASVTAFHMDTDGTNLYITSNVDIYRYNLTTDTLEATSFITTTATGYSGIYGLNVIDDKIYVADANDYALTGFVYEYNLMGSLLQTYTVGQNPNHIYKSAQSNLGNNTNNLARISVYPNPTTDLFYVNSVNDLKVKIYDLSGKMLKYVNSSKEAIDVSDFSNGLYLIELAGENQKQIIKLIKK